MVRAWQLRDSWWTIGGDLLLSRCQCMGQALLLGTKHTVGAGAVCPEPDHSLCLTRSDRSDSDTSSEAEGKGVDLLSFEQKVQELEEDWVRFIQIQLTPETMDLA